MQQLAWVVYDRVGPLPHPLGGEGQTIPPVVLVQNHQAKDLARAKYRETA